MTPYNCYPYRCNALHELNHYDTDFRMQPAATGIATTFARSLSCIAILVTTKCWGMSDWAGLSEEEFTKDQYVPNSYDGSGNEIAPWEDLIIGKGTQRCPIASKLYRNGRDTMALLKSCRLI
mmetsp:Transcript_40135/g.46971  ORF Transcript_40135/g.46971 Transcript_40135/m.46971 type:complete len:122 (-) Transcript_40135:94-459(-)